MKKSKSYSKNEGSAVRATIITVLSVIVMLMLFTVIITSLVANQTLNAASTGPMCAAATAVSVFLGGWIGTVFAAGQYPISICAGAATVLLVLFCVNALLFDGNYPGIGQGIAMVFLGGAAVFAIKLARAKAGKKGRYKYRYG